MHFSLYLGYMRFMFSTPCLFVNKHPCFCLASLFCVYILYNIQTWWRRFEWENGGLCRDSFYLCALKCIRRYIQNRVADGFLFGEKVHKSFSRSRFCWGLWSKAFVLKSLWGVLLKQRCFTWWSSPFLSFPLMVLPCLLSLRQLWILGYNKLITNIINSERNETEIFE